ncbi:MAG TPA: SDR family NAD(P)-dependent oxidoreductase [Candidatus Saccharimonadales bacterium]|jgi:nucleoside-diphosphate-sugar epimerase|nr:SDR family NAD(P)-dependent oxidoreductase [Candidatus Saccharimonadales bacterium]
MAKTYLVTGGSGFLGSALVRRLVHDGHRVRVFDNNSRGKMSRLDGLRGDFELIEGDIRDLRAVERAVKGVDSVCHLAFINGTQFFYSDPALVLEVAIKGIMHVVDACTKHGVGELILASSSEVYHEPHIVPTDETAPLIIPNPWNPRYSYAAGKLISEIVALNYSRTRFERVVIFRPHNVYGPDMGWEHVIPQFVIRMKRALGESKDTIRFSIQGTGKQTRAFIFVEDFIDGLILVMEKGEHRGIYHIGTMEEVTIESLAHLVGEFFGVQVAIVASDPAVGGAERRCPDIRRLASLGFSPKWPLAQGLPIAARWYDDYRDQAPVEMIKGGIASCSATKA